MDKVRVAILGQGRSGRNIHAANLSKMGDMYEIVAITESLPERRERAKKEYGCEILSDYTELFKKEYKLDLVVNALPSHFHVPVSLDLLKHGFNVLSEKPAAKTAAEIDELIKTAKENNVLYAIFQQSRYAPHFVEAIRIIKSGVLGRIIQISMENNAFARRWDWQTVQAFNAGSLYNTGPHPVDQALRFLDYDGMPNVTCFMDCVNTFGDAEDYVKLILSAPGRPIIDIEISSCCPYPAHFLSIHAERGGLKASTSHIDYTYYVPKEAKDQHLIMTPLSKTDGTPAYCGEHLEMHTVSWEAPPPDDGSQSFELNTGAFYTMLYNVLKKGGKLEITPEQVRQQIAVMEEAHRQATLPVTVKP